MFERAGESTGETEERREKSDILREGASVGACSTTGSGSWTEGSTR